jgi:MOSC domain-containing protein YiiM
MRAVNWPPPLAIAAPRIGQARPLGPNGRLSAIDKHAVHGPLWLDALGLRGDQQADRRVHGGVDKALHYFPAEHYRSLAAEDPGLRLAVGDFGENLSGLGLLEQDVCLGDVFALGPCRVQLSQGRQPCWKLNVRFARPDMARRVQDSGRVGWYFRVLQPGWLQAGDVLQLLARPWPDSQLARVLRALNQANVAADERLAVAALPGVPPRWRERLLAQAAHGHREDAARLDAPAGPHDAP